MSKRSTFVDLTRDTSDDDVEIVSAPPLAKRGPRKMAQSVQSLSDTLRNEAADQAEAARRIEDRLHASIQRAAASVTATVEGAQKLETAVHAAKVRHVAAAQKTSVKARKTVEDAIETADTYAKQLMTTQFLARAGTAKPKYAAAMAALKAVPFPAVAQPRPMLQAVGTPAITAFAEVRSDELAMRIVSVGYGRVMFQVFDAFTNESVGDLDSARFRVSFGDKPLTVLDINTELQNMLHSDRSSMIRYSNTHDRNFKFELLGLRFDNAKRAFIVNFYATAAYDTMSHPAGRRCKLLWPAGLAVSYAVSDARTLSATVPNYSEDVFKLCMTRLHADKITKKATGVISMNMMTVKLQYAEADKPDFNRAAFIRKLAFDLDSKDVYLFTRQEIDTFLELYFLFKAYHFDAGIVCVDLKTLIGVEVPHDIATVKQQLLEGRGYNFLFFQNMLRGQLMQWILTLDCVQLAEGVGEVTPDMLTDFYKHVLNVYLDE